MGEFHRQKSNITKIDSMKPALRDVFDLIRKDIPVKSIENITKKIGGIIASHFFILVNIFNFF